MFIHIHSGRFNHRRSDDNRFERSGWRILRCVRQFWLIHMDTPPHARLAHAAHAAPIGPNVIDLGLLVDSVPGSARAACSDGYTGDLW